MASSSDYFEFVRRTPTTLRHIPLTDLPPRNPEARSDKIRISPVPADAAIRAFYLNERNHGRYLVPPPLISSSGFVPPALITLLMRKKKNGALGVKFVPSGGQGSRPDEITNMEGALHSFVTPVIGICEIAGDYRYHGKHGIVAFGDDAVEDRRQRKRLTRTVVLSASIMLDFEDVSIMLKVCCLEGHEIIGKDKGPVWNVMRIDDKQIDEKRHSYDEALKRHMIYHLKSSGSMPSRREVTYAMDVKSTVKFLEDAIHLKEDKAAMIIGRFSEIQTGRIISLELLFNAAVHQVQNELSALEAMCPQGYVYTYDPASIFAQKIGAPILNRLVLLAFAHFSAHNTFHNLRVFAFNDYAEKRGVALARASLSAQSHVMIIPAAQGALLVIHNNSDAFGQNIETEWETGSLDGAVGFNCSGAASLERSRPDLLSFVSPPWKH
ncbi:hypothetical protein BJ878DRAFT_482644 [Calycina marina]|uniref:Uncharacterized protein n=1 Tax=Calycina marina TaxID=1763456 RepID=A0A9P7YZ14_9HELO|nr:hypothetical protein BJ878DRAFT_482644 [Calycina marina]